MSPELISSLINLVGNKAEGQISKRVLYKKTKHAKFSEKRTFLTPSYAYAHARVRIWG